MHDEKIFLARELIIFQTASEIGVSRTYVCNRILMESPCTRCALKVRDDGRCCDKPHIFSLNETGATTQRRIFLSAAT